MKKLKETLTELSETTVAVTKLDGVLFVTISALIGVILGMLCSPRKNARYGCNNGNTMIHNWGDEEALEDDMFENETVQDEDCLSFK